MTSRRPILSSFKMGAEGGRSMVVQSHRRPPPPPPSDRCARKAHIECTVEDGREVTAADFEPLSPPFLFLVELPILRKPCEATTAAVAAAPEQGPSNRPTERRRPVAALGRYATVARARSRGPPTSLALARPIQATRRAGKHLAT